MPQIPADTDREPVVLLHCSAADGGQWDGLAARLGPRYRAHALHQFNCGDGPRWHGRGPFTLDAEAAPVLDLIAGLDRPAHLVGHSYGGAVALHAAQHLAQHLAQHPARARPGALASLTLIEPVAFHLLPGAGHGAHLATMQGVARAVGGAVLAGDLWGGMATFVEFWNGPGAWDRTPDKVRAGLARRLPKVALDFHAVLATRPEPAAVAAVAAPTLLLHGEASPGPTVAVIQVLAGLLPGARVAAVAGAGHMAPFTHAGPVNDAVAGHVAAAAARRRAA
ncbi:MAG: alpha/beta fold hydrolase [Hyphomicrobiales bacterium]|nr:alpha/beta fold hydrolase [Hyphomicrobiales bacterium]